MVITETRIKDLVLIAGKGELPILLAKTAQEAGVKLVVLALNKETYKNFRNKAETYLYSPVEVYPIVNKIKELGCIYSFKPFPCCMYYYI